MKYNQIYVSKLDIQDEDIFFDKILQRIVTYNHYLELGAGYVFKLINSLCWTKITIKFLVAYF